MSGFSRFVSKINFLRSGSLADSFVRSSSAIPLCIVQSNSMCIVQQHFHCRGTRAILLCKKESYMFNFVNVFLLASSCSTVVKNTFCEPQKSFFASLRAVPTYWACPAGRPGVGYYPGDSNSMQGQKSVSICYRHVVASAALA